MRVTRLKLPGNPKPWRLRISQFSTGTPSNHNDREGLLSEHRHLAMGSWSFQLSSTRLEWPHSIDWLSRPEDHFWYSARRSSSGGGSEGLYFLALHVRILARPCPMKVSSSHSLRSLCLLYCCRALTSIRVATWGLLDLRVRGEGQRGRWHQLSKRGRGLTRQSPLNVLCVHSRFHPHGHYVSRGNLWCTPGSRTTCIRACEHSYQPSQDYYRPWWNRCCNICVCRRAQQGVGS